MIYFFTFDFVHFQPDDHLVSLNVTEYFGLHEAHCDSCWERSYYH